MKAMLIGAGLIGTRLYEKLTERGWEIPAVVRSSGIYSDLSKTNPIQRNLPAILDSDNYNFMFLSIPTSDHGTTAKEYMDLALARGIPIVTCEKGALSHHYRHFQPHLHRIGHTATVGGGSRLLYHLKTSPNPKAIHAIVNGTLNFLADYTSYFNGKDEKQDLKQAIEEAKERGYAEPGASSQEDVINQELTSDIPMKTAILVNSSGLLSRLVSPDEFQTQRLNRRQIDFVFARSDKYRHFVSITREKPRKEVKIGGFDLEIEGWHLKGGFRRLTPENCQYLMLRGAGNTLALMNEQGKFAGFSGAGAGADPTTETMLTDAQQFIQNRHF